MDDAQTLARPPAISGALGLVAVSSPDFLTRLLAASATGRPVVLLRDAQDNARIAAGGVSEVIEPTAGAGWLAPQFTPSDSDAIAQLVFSSGTTGAAKAIALSHANIADATRRLIAAQALDGSVREYLGVPVTYSFGLGRARAIGAVGGALYLPPHGFDPGEIAAMLKAGTINAVAAVPTLWRLLLANAELFAGCGEGLRWIEIGSQAMAAGEKAALRALFPNARILQHYGLTEASRTTFLRIDDADTRALDSVGSWTAPIDVAVVDGRIRVRGPHVARWRWQDGGFALLTDAAGWLDTGDLGRIDQGQLYFEGRSDDQINCGGIKLSAEALEAAIGAALGQRDAIGVARTNDALRGEGVLVAHQAAAGLHDDAVRAAAQAATQALGLHAGSAITVLRVDALPRTETGKLQRHLLSALAGDALAADAPLQTRLVALWGRTLGIDRVDPALSFFDLGGEPLLGHALIEAMEAEGVSAQAAAGLWDGLSIADIVANAAPKPSAPSAQERILGIWRETLGRDDVSLDEGFYDVGGDSLSAITLALSMERAGFDPVLARAIFDGKSIAQLAADADAAAGAPADAPVVPLVRTKTQVALLSEGLNLVKGILVLCMVASHWVPIYLGYFGLRGGRISAAIEPFLTMGSPTLAYIFGIGIAVFHARQYAGHGPAFRANVRNGALLLAVGLLAGATLEFFANRATQPDFGADGAVLALSNGPFAYYLLATLSIPLWIGVLQRRLAVVQRLLGAACLAYLAYLMLLHGLPETLDNRAAQAGRDLIVGHWGLFQLGALTLSGAATGLLIEMHLRGELGAPGRLSAFAPWGLLLMAAGIIISIAAKDFGTWFVPHEQITLWSAVFYAGLALTIIAGFERLNRALANHPLLRFKVQLIMVFGILLFPLYVLQSFVYHSAYLLNLATGQSLIRMLTMCIALFAVAAAWPVWRVYRLYYADRR